MKEKQLDMNLYKLAKFISHEITMKYQLESAGSNQARMLEKFEKNEKYVRNMTVFQKIMIAFYFSFLSLVPLFTYFEIMASVNDGGVPRDALILTGAFVIFVYLGLQSAYLLIIGMPVIGSLMSGEAFRYLETLPISREKLRKLSFLTVFRNYDIPMVAMFLVFPIVMFIGTQNILVLLACLGISALNVPFTLSILVLVGEKMDRFMKKHEEGSAKATIIRVITMLSYIGIMFVIIFLIQGIMNALPQLFEFFSSLEFSPLLNYLFSLIPFPFAPGYIISLIMVPFKMSPFLWMTSLTGLVLFIFLVRSTYKKALICLNSVVSEEGRTSTKKTQHKIPTEDIEVIIEPKTPIKAFIRKDLTTASRDLQTLMFFILPFVIPIVSLIPMIAGISSSTSEVPGIEEILVPWSMIFIFSIINIYMMITGLLNMEESGASLLASLPINTRDQAIAKLIIIFTIVSAAFILPLLFLITLPGVLDILCLSFASITIVWALIFIVFELKVYLFGKMTYKYVLEELNPQRKVLKWIALLLTGMGSFFVVLIMSFMCYIFLGIIFTGILLIIIGSILLSCSIFIFTHMFPKARK